MTRKSKCSLVAVRSNRWLRTHRRSAAVASCVLGALVGIAAVVVLSTSRPSSPGWYRQPRSLHTSSRLLAVHSAGSEVPAPRDLAPDLLAEPPSQHAAAGASHEARGANVVLQQHVTRDPLDWDPSRVNLTSCMAEDADETPFSVGQFEAAQPGRLRVEAAFYSRQGRVLPVTVTVTVTTGKLPNLKGLCTSWPGPLSVAFYLAAVSDDPQLETKVTAAVAAVNATYKQLERLGRCQADIVVYSERVADEAAAALFPINTLRNNAILLARTPLVLLADADLLIGADLAEAMADPLEYQQALDLCRRKHFLVVPVLETYRDSYASKCARGGKRVVTKFMKDKKAWGFRMRRTEVHHGSTDFRQWAKAEAPYPVLEPHERYEPWGVMHRAALGFFDTRYRGYGRNKIQHLHMHMKQMGWRYSVHHRGYMMHRPHGSTAAKQQFMAGHAIAAEASAAVAAGADPKAALAAAAAQGAPGSLLVFASNNGFFEDQKAAGDRYRPLLTPGFQRCRAQLPWWQIYGAGGEPMPAVTAAAVVEPGD